VLPEVTQLRYLEKITAGERESERAVLSAYRTGEYTTGAMAGSGGCLGIGDVDNNKTTSAAIGHIRTFLTVFCFLIPKEKMLTKFTLPSKSNCQYRRFCSWCSTPVTLQ
jgi:hypothetical protein